ncbi:hypothetical protein G9A89_015828 [Geosiphon pyriformis]|nr:hypothetical protein G9A89_015828 [Geosiphon pyriformis]
MHLPSSNSASQNTTEKKENVIAVKPCERISSSKSEVEWELETEEDSENCSKSWNREFSSQGLYERDETKLDDKSCRCGLCQKGLNPSTRSDFRTLENRLYSIKLLREVALFAGTRDVTDKIVDHFHSTWENPLHMGRPVVETISFIKYSPKIAQRFDECLSEFTLIADDPNVKPFWRGTRVECEYDQESSCNPNSVLFCRSCQSIFRDQEGDNSHDKRIYFSTNSSHCYSTVESSSKKFKIQLCFAALGKSHTFNPLVDTNEELREAPYPCHSVVLQKKNFEEIILYRSDSFIPFAYVTYRIEDCKNCKSEMNADDIRAVVAIDFGTTFSGFAYAHKANREIETNCQWPGNQGTLKTNTALRYDQDSNLIAWGEAALIQTPEKKKKTKIEYTIELFKLHLTEMENKPYLPAGMNYKKPICDYLKSMYKLIQETLEKTWPGLQISQVMYVMTIPAEWRENTKAIMRECAHAAGIIEQVDSKKLEFTSEPEAAAVHCLNVVKEHSLKLGDAFLVVDCGGGTVDLTTRTLNAEQRLGEITERTGDLCGSTFIDREFLKYLGRKIGFSALEKVKKNHYGQLQYLIQKFFCPRVKFIFDGNPENFKPIELDLEHYCPTVVKYVVGDQKDAMEKDDWVIELDFDSVKAMFDPVVTKVIKLITGQLKAASSIVSPSAMFLVGGFSESKYLRRRIKETFGDQVPIIAEPRQPISAVVKGAVAYGLDMNLIETRILKWCFGIKVLVEWNPELDSLDRRTPEGLVNRFQHLAERMDQVQVDKEFSAEFKPVYQEQTSASFKVYYTSDKTARYCDQLDVFYLGKLQIDLPDVHLGINRPIQFALNFGKMELKATAQNKTTGQIYQTSWFMDNFAN